MQIELSLVIDALPGLVWTALPDGRGDFLNQRWCEYTGLTVDEARGRGWHVAIHPVDLPKLLAAWEAILASHAPGEAEARLRRFDGACRPFRFSISPLRDTHGVIVKWCVINTEIGDRRRAEALPGARERRSQSIIDGLPAIVTLLTPRGALQHANRQMLEYFGKTLEELKAQAPGSSFHPDDRSEALVQWSRSVGTGDPYDFEARLQRADGVYRWFHTRGFPLRDVRGGITAWYLLQADIDDRRRAEDLLSGENRLLEMMATGQSLPKTLDELCLLVERLCPTCACCSILLLDQETARLWHAASPNVPRAYTDAIDGFAIGPEASSCGSAAFHQRQVIASDIATDSRWAEFRALALANGLRACWSSPILSQQNRVLGTFAIFSGEPGAPSEHDEAAIAQVTHLASVAIERAQNDAALKASEVRKAAILDSALDCIVTMDHEGRVTEFNPAAERTFGYNRDEVLGEPLADLIIPPSLREEHRRGLAHYLATGEAPIIGKRLEMLAVRSDGREFPVDLTITRIPLDGPPAFTGYLRDITERKRSEQALQRSNAYLAEAQRLSLTGSFTWDVSADEHSWSDETFRILELDPAIRITLQTILDRAHPEDAPIIRRVIAPVRDGKNFDFECRFLMPSGAVKHGRIVAHRIHDQRDRLIYCGAIQDVTERKLSEEAFDNVRSELAHVARVTSLGALSASITHEISQPLSGIITNAGTCLRMLAADPPNVIGAIETARRTLRDGNRASDVIGRLRALFTKKSAAMDTVDLNEAAREVIALSGNDLQRRGVVLRSDLAEDLPLVTADRVQLQQVILNLLLNASDAMSGIRDRPRLIAMRTEREEGDRVRLTLQDSGEGFEAEAAEKLFDAFYTSKSGGMGIGLSVSRSIIEWHHGRLWAVRNDGPGATFAFSIPRIPPVVRGAVSLASIDAGPVAHVSAPNMSQ